MTGTKVEAIHHHGVSEVEHFVVGRVLEVEQHPDADRLKVCKVDLGAGEDQPRRRRSCAARRMWRRGRRSRLRRRAR